VSERRPILVVDDDPDVVAIVQRVLGHAGWDVLGTSDAREAITLAVEHEPCLLLVDLMMPHIDGEELVAELRVRLRDRMPKIALVSAAYTRIEVGRRMDVDAVLSKPFEMSDLRDLAVRFAGEHRDRPSSTPPR
jgi:two-component system alkaline phosphatase synthesis response regulator PhoP